MKTSRLITLAVTLIATYSCSKSADNTIPRQGTPNTFSISKAGTAFFDAEFTNGDQIGLYIAQRTNASTSGILKPSGNLFDNKQFTYNDGAMSAVTTQTYPEGVEWVDMYGYAPYSATGLDSDTKLSFTVKANQSASLTPSDLLWVTKMAVQTTATTPALNFSHKLSKVVVKLSAGVGVTFTTPTVMINNTLPSIKFDMTAGTLGAAEGIATPITTHNTPSTTEYQAIITPQQISLLTNFIIITNGSKTYNYTLTAAKTFESGKVYTYEITVNANDLSVKISGSVGDWGDGGTTAGDAN